MEISWLNLLWHDMIGLILLGLISEIRSYGAALNRFEQRWGRFMAQKQWQQAKLASQALPGLGHRLGCAECRGGASQSTALASVEKGTTLEGPADLAILSGSEL
jgi:hypothetical protein